MSQLSLRFCCISWWPRPACVRRALQPWSADTQGGFRLSAVDLGLVESLPAFRHGESSHTLYQEVGFLYPLFSFSLDRPTISALCQERAEVVVPFSTIYTQWWQQWCTATCAMSQWSRSVCGQLFPTLCTHTLRHNSYNMCCGWSESCCAPSGSLPRDWQKTTSSEGKSTVFLLRENASKHLT